MAGLFEGIAPPNVNTTRTTAQQAPQYLTDYLTNLAQAGTSALGTTTPAVKDAAGNITTPALFTPKTGEDLIASRPDYLANLTSGIDPATGRPYAAGQLPALSDLTRYQTPLDQALTAGKSAMDVSSADIAKFYNPYQQQVIDEMQKQSDINLQRSVLPGLKALGVSGGQFGGSRVGNIGGQALADIAARLQAQQTEARSKGFETALDAALREQTGQTGAATALTGLGSQEQQAAKSALGTLSDLGSQQLAYEQSKIEAPLTRAANVAALLRNYQYPTTTTETYKGPGTVYGPSTLQQIAGLGSLVGAAFPVDPKTGQLTGIGTKVISGASDLLGKIFGGSSGTSSGTSGYGEGLQDNANITMPGSTPYND